MRSPFFVASLFCLLAGLAGTASAQNYGSRLGVQRGGRTTFEPQGSGVLFDAIDPAIKKWYIPQELFNEYRWRQWEYSNYARSPYQRYVDVALEGSYFYDFFGNFVNRGWLIYNNSQSQPLQRGNELFKDGRFGNWFNSLLIASDSVGEYHYAITIGNGIRTTLTPMTFSKPDFDGGPVRLGHGQILAHLPVFAAERIGWLGYECRGHQPH